MQQATHLDVSSHACLVGQPTIILSIKGQQANIPLLSAAPSQLSEGLDAAPQTDCSPVMQELVSCNNGSHILVVASS